MSKVILIFLLTSASGAELPNKFIRALHQTETKGRYGPIKGDNGRALGPFQIHFECWLDSGVPGEYSQCEKYDYSVKVVTAYLNRYDADAVKSHNFESLARVWNGGPSGDRSKKTIPYWKKFKKNL